MIQDKVNLKAYAWRAGQATTFSLWCGKILPRFSAQTQPVWKQSGPMLSACCAHVGPSRAHVEPSWAHLGPILGLCWPYVAPCMVVYQQIPSYKDCNLLCGVGYAIFVSRQKDYLCSTLSCLRRIVLTWWTRFLWGLHLEISLDCHLSPRAFALVRPHRNSGGFVCFSFFFFPHTPQCFVTLASFCCVSRRSEVAARLVEIVHVS